MKKNLLSVLIVLALILGMIPNKAYAGTTGSGGSQTNDCGTFSNGATVIKDMLKKNGDKPVHPRLIMTEEKFRRLRSHINDNSVTAELLEELRGEANRYLKENPAEYDADGEDHLLETSKRIQRRVATLALAYNIFEDDVYAERCYKELEKACGYKDWSPKHFLDTAEMCTAFAYGYDWLYNYLTPERRSKLKDAMIKKGLTQVMEDYTDTPSNRKRTYKWYQDQVGDNWQLVCTGGTNLAALAIGDESDATEIASKVLDYGFKRAYSFVRRAYSTKDGTYIEGLGYWDYATYYLGLQSSALISATGTDYGLADYDGVRKSVEFVRYMSSNTPKSFSFGDDRESRDTGWAVFLWLGEHLDSPEISSVRLRKIKEDPEFNYLDVLWINEDKKSDSENKNDVDWGSVGACNASFRNTWDVSGIVAALHVGENNYKYHGHYDLGSFYVESNGSRFFTDLGNESYSLENRKYSYRIKPEGHNTLVINPTADTDQVEGANCLITEYNSGNEAYAVTDLTKAYEANGAKSVARGLKMIKDKECVIVQDEITLKSSGEIYWFAHTKGDISVASDGKSAIVTVGSDKLWVGLLSDTGKFSVMKAEPLSTSCRVSGATSNSEYRKLAIHLTQTKNATISVACIPLKKGEKKPSWIPSVKAISEWAPATQPEEDSDDGKNTDVEKPADDGKNTDVEKPADSSINDVPAAVKEDEPDVAKSNPDTKKPDSGSKYEKLSDGKKYLVLSKAKTSDIKKNTKISDAKSQGIYKLTTITKKKGKITGGTVAYLKPYNSDCKTAVIKASVKIAGVSFKVTSVSESAFKNCKKLTKVTIGENVSSIGKSAFYGCKKLNNIVLKTKMLKSGTIGFKAFSAINTKTNFKVPKAKLKLYKKLLSPKEGKSRFVFKSF